MLYQDGGKVGKGGYHKSDSYKGNKGYSDYTTYNKANKDSYGDGDHKEYGNRDGGIGIIFNLLILLVWCWFKKYIVIGHSGGGHEGGNSYGGQSGGSRSGNGRSGGYFEDGGRGKYSGDYSDNGNSYLSAGGGYWEDLVATI